MAFLAGADSGEGRGGRSRFQGRRRGRASLSSHEKMPLAGFVQWREAACELVRQEEEYKTAAVGLAAVAVARFGSSGGGAGSLRQLRHACREWIETRAEKKKRKEKKRTKRCSASDRAAAATTTSARGTSDLGVACFEPRAAKP